MQPISPVLTEEFVPDEVVYAKDQPAYNPLPTLRDQDGVVVSRWKLTDEERQAISEGADIHLSIHTFNGPLQPIRLEILSCDRDVYAMAIRMGLLTDV
jgi:hypothetical protein